MIEIPITEELENICKEILSKDLSLEQWSEIESDDMFQSKIYSGGYDSDEQAFCFSLYKNGKEFWFQITLGEVILIVNGDMNFIKVDLVDE